MNLQYYYNFVTIVEEGSLTAASRKLHIAQPALSNQIKAMEEKYGTRLFFRGARRLELTDAGMILYQKAKRMCEIEQSAQNEIASGFSGQKGILRFGATPDISYGRIASALVTFAQKYPQTEIKYLLASPADLCKMLQNGIIEVAAVKTMDQIPENVQLLDAVEEPTVALYKPDMGLLDKGRKDSVTIRQLSGVPIAMEELYYRRAANVFKEKDATLYLKTLSSSALVPLEMAKAGLAVALASEHAAVAMGSEGLAVKRITDGAPISARYCLLVQRGNYRSQVANNFLSILAKTLDMNLKGVRTVPEEEKEE
ncbi:MAG: LysR family transcriptional regulator [Clostridia bacterium]|nr:LysR family transcriptional regulator [Clostridia bacterium]